MVSKAVKLPHPLPIELSYVSFLYLFFSVDDITTRLEKLCINMSGKENSRVYKSHIKSFFKRIRNKPSWVNMNMERVLDDMYYR